MSDYNYWEDAVECAVNEIDGLELTVDQIKALAGSIEVSADMRRECCGPPIEPGYSQVEIERREHERRAQALEDEYYRETEKMKAAHQQRIADMRWAIARLREQLEEARDV